MNETGQWTEADDEAYGRLMRGTDANPSYERVLLTTALEDYLQRLGGKIMRAYAAHRVSLDTLLEKLRERAPAPAGNPRNPFGPGYRLMLTDIIREQYRDDPEILARLMTQLGEEV